MPNLVTGTPSGIPAASAQDRLSDGDRVAMRFTLTGTYAVELFGVPQALVEDVRPISRISPSTCRKIR
jgi:hypothetical protein